MRLSTNLLTFSDSMNLANATECVHTTSCVEMGGVVSKWVDFRPKLLKNRTI